MCTWTGSVTKPPKLRAADLPRAIEFSAINPLGEDDQMTPNIQATASKTAPSNGSAGPEHTDRLRSVKTVLTDEMLAHFASRAAAYDRENRFFQEDFDELRVAKYLQLPLPSEFGGAGMTLAELCCE